MTVHLERTTHISCGISLSHRKRKSSSGSGVSNEKAALVNTSAAIMIVVIVRIDRNDACIMGQYEPHS